MTALNVIIPASNEAGLIGNCLTSVVSSRLAPGQACDVVVVANGCKDNTAAVARQYEAAARANGMSLSVIEVATGDKLNAMNLGDSAVSGGIRVYLDADIVLHPGLLQELVDLLATPEPRYATGKIEISRARNWFSRAYARFWSRLPFMTDDAPGCGLFAVNPAGRARWQAFPQIISDDTFVRLHFTRNERFETASRFSWPVVEGFGNLVRVRRRQNQGVREIATLYPHLIDNEQKSALTWRTLAARIAADPVGFAVYGAVSAMTRLPGRNQGWARGR